MEKISSHPTPANIADSIRVISVHNTAVPPHVDNLFDIPIDFFGLLDEITIGVVVLDLDRKIVAMNQTLKALTGFNQKEFAGVACAHILRSNVCLQNCPALRVQ